MRMLLLYILFLALSCEQRAFLESENLKTSESEKGCEPRAMSNEHRFRKAQSSQLEAQCLKKTVDYFENQIRLADSLYKNYLPQYNFEEVKAAVMFFDSCEQRAMSNEPFLESENLKTSESEKGCEPRAMSHEPFLESENLKTSESEKRLKSQGRNAQSSQLEAQSPENNVDHHELLKFQNSKILEFLRARAHYYHAVGLTERDDIVGACEHYFIALEIMESETENLKTSKYRKGSEQRAMSRNSEMLEARSSKLKALITKK